jgi:hypothetical protein
LAAKKKRKKISAFLSFAKYIAECGYCTCTVVSNSSKLYTMQHWLIFFQKRTNDKMIKMINDKKQQRGLLSFHIQYILDVLTKENHSKQEQK